MFHNLQFPLHIFLLTRIAFSISSIINVLTPLIPYFSFWQFSPWSSKIMCKVYVGQSIIALIQTTCSICTYKDAQRCAQIWNQLQTKCSLYDMPMIPCILCGGKFIKNWQSQPCLSYNFLVGHPSSYSLYWILRRKKHQ